MASGADATEGIPPAVLAEDRAGAEASMQVWLHARADVLADCLRAVLQ